MGFREINMVSGLVNMHGPIWQTFETISARNPCRLFQKFTSAARHGRPSTACSDELLQQSAPGIRAVCFKSQSPAARHGRPSTARSDELLQQSAPGIRAVCFKSPSRRPVTAVRPRPDPTARPGGLLQQSAWGIRAVCFKSPSQRSVTDVRHSPLWRPSETNGAPYGRPHECCAGSGSTNHDSADRMSGQFLFYHENEAIHNDKSRNDHDD